MTHLKMSVTKDVWMCDKESSEPIDGGPKGRKEQEMFNEDVAGTVRLRCDIMDMKRGK